MLQVFPLPLYVVQGTELESICSRKRPKEVYTSISNSNFTVRNCSLCIFDCKTDFSFFANSKLDFFLLTMQIQLFILYGCICIYRYNH